MCNNEKKCAWHFSKQPEATQDIGPNNAATEYFKETPYPSLIRESIQNSLDVMKDPSEPVRMKFSFKRLRTGAFDNFFKLKEHIEGVISYFGKKADAEYKPMLEVLNRMVNNQGVIDYIQVSDFNTKGMDFNPDDTDSPFYAFIRAIGVTVKSDIGSGGSFGFGKSAYFAMSPIHTVLVSTLTESGKSYFEGASTLCTHKYADVPGHEYKCTHYGFYDNQNGKRPASGDEIPTRFKREEVGTDIMIMGVDGSDIAKNVANDEMIKATLRNFWMSVYDKKLEVVIGEVSITAETLDNLMRSHFPEMTDRVKSHNSYNPRPYYEAVKNSGVSKQYPRFDDVKPNLGKVVLYMNKNRDARDGVIHMRKQGMFIYRARFYSTSYGYSAVFVCPDARGNNILKKIEDPSHSRWERTRGGALGSEAMKEIEDFISDCLNKAFVNDQGGPLGITGLEDYLFVPEDLLASDADEKGNPFLGNPDKEPLKEGLTPTSDISSDPSLKSGMDEPLGNVVVRTPPVSAKGSPDGTLGGHKRQSAKTRKRGMGNSPGKDGYVESEGSADGEYLKNVPVEYRVIAENKNGILVHTLIIHSEYDVQDGRIEILVGGEDSDEEVDIVSSSNGSPKGNLISGVVLKKDKRNLIEIVFSDHMKHVVKMTAYEFR